MILNDALTDGQPNACTREIVLAVQALEDLENSVEVLLVEADSRILNADLVEKMGVTGRLYVVGQGTTGLYHTVNGNARRLPRWRKLERIRQYVLE